MKKNTLLLAVLISASAFANKSIQSSISKLTNTEILKQEPKQEKEKICEEVKEIFCKKICKTNRI